MRSVLTFLVVAGLGCGGGTDGGGTSGGTGGGSTSSTTTTFCCSINSRSFDCPDQAAVQKCANLDNPDPSDCTRRSTSCR